MNKKKTEVNLDELDREVEKKLNPSRYQHTKNVQSLAIEMAERYNEDVYKASLAALFHDYCKDSSAENNNLLHAGMAADVLESEYDVKDVDVLNAIRYHTTGRRDMSTLELIIFLADTLEPGRSYHNLEELRESVNKDLYKGALEVLNELKKYLNMNGITESEDSIEAIEWLEEKTS